MRFCNGKTKNIREVGPLTKKVVLAGNIQVILIIGQTIFSLVQSYYVHDYEEIIKYGSIMMLFLVWIPVIFITKYVFRLI